MNQLKDLILGVITGDALGAPVQFKPREDVKWNPIKDMRPQTDYFRKAAGSWTDDSSLTLCLLDSGFAQLPEDQISSSGYVVHTLEAALWAFLSTDSYKTCLLKAVNLGDDADTVGAVAGGLAGLYYSGNQDKTISSQWLDTILRMYYIEDIIDRAINYINE